MSVDWVRHFDTLSSTVLVSNQSLCWEFKAHTPPAPIYGL